MIRRKITVPPAPAAAGNRNREENQKNRRTGSACRKNSGISRVNKTCLLRMPGSSTSYGTKTNATDIFL